MAEYAWVSLNILENAWINCSMPGLWIRLIILHVWQAFEDVSGYKCARVLNMTRLYIYKGYTEFWISLNMPQKCLNMPQFALMSLNVPAQDWILLNVPENAWIKISWLSKNVGNHVWSSTKNFKITLAKIKRPRIVQKKRNLDQKINDSKPHIWSLSFNIRFSSRKS